MKAAIPQILAIWLGRLAGFMVNEIISGSLATAAMACPVARIEFGPFRDLVSERGRLRRNRRGREEEPPLPGVAKLTCSRCLPSCAVFSCARR